VSELVALLVVAIALAAGLLANRWVRPFADSEIKGVKLEALVGPIMTLTALLVAFTIVNVFASYTRAVQSASDEARKVDFLFELGAYADEPARSELQSAVACYAAAVAGPEWDVMDGGLTAPQVSPWTAQIRGSIEAMVAADAPSPVLSSVLTADKERAEARSQRLTEARPALPGLLFALLIASAAIGVFALATFTLPYVARRVQIGVLVLLALLLAAFVALTRDLDRPYDGLIAIAPTDIERVTGDLAEDWDEQHPGEPLPCDPQGEMLGAG
jgi:Protein of unknown function (DUF4239)